MIHGAMEWFDAVSAHRDVCTAILLHAQIVLNNDRAESLEFPENQLALLVEGQRQISKPGHAGK